MALDKDYKGLKLEGTSNLQSFGQKGFRIVGTDFVSGEFVAITALEESLIDYTVPAGMDNFDVGQIVLPAGLTIYGKFTGVQALSGVVLAYNLTED